MFEWLNNFTFWKSLPYKTTGSILRAVRAALAAGIGILIAANASGTLVPPEVSPLIAVIITSALLGADKFIREWRIEAEEDKEDETTPDDDDEIPPEGEETDEPDPEPDEPIDEAPLIEDPLVNPEIPEEDLEHETELTGI